MTSDQLVVLTGPLRFSRIFEYQELPGRELYQCLRQHGYSVMDDAALEEWLRQVDAPPLGGSYVAVRQPDDFFDLSERIFPGVRHLTALVWTMVPEIAELTRAEKAVLGWATQVMYPKDDCELYCSYLLADTAHAVPGESQRGAFRPPLPMVTHDRHMPPIELHVERRIISTGLSDD